MSSRRKPGSSNNLKQDSGFRRNDSSTNGKGIESYMQKLEKIYEGKAKILYTTEDPDLLIQYFKDDATAFNAQKKGTIDQKGVMNNRITSKIFEHLKKEGIETHYVKWLNDREMLIKRVKIVPLEVI